MTKERLLTLYVDDNLGDALLMQELLAESSLGFDLVHVESGADALAMLRGEPPYEHAEQPRFVLLDINMPDMNGHEVLREIKADATLRRIPVMMFSSSDRDQDVFDSYDGYANSYVVKPHTWQEYGVVLRSIEDFWLRTARVPPRL